MTQQRYEDCQICGGHHFTPMSDLDVQHYKWEPCPLCNGDGRVANRYDDTDIDYCNGCDGAGGRWLPVATARTAVLAAALS